MVTRSGSGQRPGGGPIVRPGGPAEVAGQRSGSRLHLHRRREVLHASCTLPLTHLLRIVRGILLKGNTAAQLPPELWPMLAFLFVAGVIALKRYRQTLD